MLTLRRRWTACFILALLTAGAAVGAQDLAVRVHVGFDGDVPVAGLWPLTFVFDNRAEKAITIEIDVGDRPGASSGHPGIVRRVLVSPGATRRATIVLLGGNLEARQALLKFENALDVDLVAGSRSATRLTRRREVAVDFGAKDIAKATGKRLVVLGPQGRRIAQAAPETARLRRDPLIDWTDDWDLAADGYRAGFAALADEAWPDTWLAWSGIETIFLTEPVFLASGAGAALEQLMRWVESGGRLVLLTAAQPARLLDQFLAKYLPPGFTGVESDDYGRARSDVPFVGAGPYLAFDARDEVRRIAAPGALGWPADRAVRIERGIGRGRFIVAGFDPLVFDRGEPREFVEALSLASGPMLRYIDRLQTRGFGVDWSGRDADLDGADLKTILENRAVSAPSANVFFFAILAYIWAISVFDYQMLKRRNRLRWSPFTLLGYAAVFSVGAVATAFFGFATEAEVNRLAVVDLVESADGRERYYAHVYHGLYTPFGARFETAPKGDADVFARFVGGGSSQAFEAPGRQIMRPALPTNSARVVESVASGEPLGTVTASIASEIVGGEVWKITISNGFDKKLRRPILFWRRGAYPLPDVEPGATIAEMFDPRTLNPGPAVFRGAEFFPRGSFVGLKWENDDGRRREQTGGDDTLYALLAFYSVRSLAPVIGVDMTGDRYFERFEAASKLGADEGLLIGCT